MVKNKDIILLIVIVGHLLSNLCILFFFILLFFFFVNMICLYQSVGMCIRWSSCVGFRLFLSSNKM